MNMTWLTQRKVELDIEFEGLEEEMDWSKGRDHVYKVFMGLFKIDMERELVKAMIEHCHNENRCTCEKCMGCESPWDEEWDELLDGVELDEDEDDDAV